MRARRPLPFAVSVRLVRGLLSAVCGLALVVVAGQAWGQFGGGFGNQAVGGISIDADGIVRNLEPRALQSLAEERAKALAEGEGPAVAGKFRKVSLRALEAAAAESAAQGKPLAPGTRFLGGLERITHVFVDPDGHDIVLCGPADAIAVDAAGNVVGATSRRPLLQLEDLVVALRGLDRARQGGMRCSIDPSPEGIARLDAFLRRQGTIGQDPQATLRAMETAVGPQVVTVGGVPASSRFARVLVAADYRMKRIGMGLDESGLKELPSYLALVPAGARVSSLPRFWLEAEYDPIERDADELAWRIGGRRMKCLTESDLAGKDGIQRGAGAVDTFAQKWCTMMTGQYAALEAKHPVFAELTNCVDLAVVAALIHGRQLDKRAGLDLGVLLDEAKLPVPAYEAPETIPTVATGIKKGSNWVVSASGGVQFQPWEFAATTKPSADIAADRTQALAARASVAGGWWD